MRSDTSNRLYLVLAGTAVATVIAILVVYMWMDARKLEQSLAKPASKPTPAQEVSEPTTAQTGLGEANPASQRQPIKERQPLPQQDAPEPERPVKADREQPKGENTTQLTDDWRFKKGENVEKAPSETRSISE